MVKRIGLSVIVGIALFGLMATGMLAKHRELRKAAIEMLKLDVEILVGG